MNTKAGKSFLAFVDCHLLGELKLKYLVCVLFTLFSVKILAHDSYISLQTPTFELVIDEVYSQTLSFDSLPATENIALTHWANKPKATIYYGDIGLSISSHDGEIERVHINYKHQTKTITFHIQEDPAVYSKAYQHLHNGKVSVEIPEVFELNNIILALSDKFHHTQFKMYSEGSYYADVIDWFSPLKNHDIFSQLEQDDFYTFIENGAAYRFVENQILPSSVYKGFRPNDKIKDVVALLEDFALKSNFKQFYNEHQTFYAELVNLFHSGTKPNTIWQWLEFHFPNRYQSYKVYFSPLGAGNHSARMFTNNDFNEAIMFISAPNRYAIPQKNPSLESIKLTRSFFTEIDHAYINPISKHHINEINNAMPELSRWYRGGSYNSPYLIFNEYMTWSVFLLYAQEHYSIDQVHIITNHVENVMNKRRGFCNFISFNSQLKNLYSKRKNGDKIVALYPQIIHWMKTQPPQKTC